ncbi:cation channel sperm-associated protein subunit delta-domain-containing protein [Chytriomyces sp. MP71]|nr:cation channel sperm-associated protein subunit delta-domain-containing protein [Chytriomyces sp. MP71]
MRVFYGSPALYTMLEVSAGISTGSLAVLGFDSAQRLLIYQPSSSSNYVTSRVVSIPNEMQSPRAPTASNPTLVCPYSSWVSSMQSRYTVDIGESASFAINVTTLGATSGDVLFSFSNYSLISVTTASSKSTISDPFGSSNPIWVTTTNLTINPTSIALLGDSIITVRPKEENLACNKINGQAAVTVGCSNTRVMVLRPPSAVAPTIGQIISQNVCTHAPTSVLLAAGSWISDWTSFSRPNYDKYISYNCSLYGPPIDLYYGEVFSPAFDLYDQGVFVKRVTANIGLWDVNGRAFQFNMTNGDAGCTGPAQTWFGMVASTSNPSLAWNSTNYVPCFTSVGPVDRTSQYTIFNASNGLGIVWSGGYNGVFMITATVLDPSYSYCPLSANFAINVYGAPLPAWTQAGIIIGMTLVFLFVLTMSYFLQLRDRKRNAIKIDLDQGDEEYNSKESSGVLWKAKLE